MEKRGIMNPAVTPQSSHTRSKCWCRCRNVLSIRLWAYLL